MEFNFTGYCYGVIWSIVRPYLSSNHPWFVQQSSLAAAETSSSEAGSWYGMGPTSLLPFRRKSCFGFLSPLKVHCPRPRPVLNQWALGPIASTVAITKLRTTICFHNSHSYSEWSFLFCLPSQVFACSSHLSHGCSKSRTLRPFWFDHLSNFWRAITNYECFLYTTFSS
jgi:hypothetical protein